jgi:hypothetical protein
MPTPPENLTAGKKGIVGKIIFTDPATQCMLITCKTKMLRLK